MKKLLSRLYHKFIERRIVKLVPGRFKYLVKEHYITGNLDLGWWENHINNIVLKQYSGELSGIVADFGCNHGICTILAARNPNIKNIVGFDMNKKAISAAKEFLLASNEPGEVKNKISFTASAFDKIDYPDSYFDNAFMLHTIEHIYENDRKSVFSNIKRLLKNGAHLLITAPFGHAYDEGFEHVAFFNVESLRLAMENLGFTVIECYRDQRSDAHLPDGHDCLNILCKILK